MNRTGKENLKSLGIGLVALALLALWLELAPTPPDARPEEKVGQRMFPGFEDPTLVRSIRIVRRIDGAEKPSAITLTDTDGRWTIAEYLSFPAENAKQMARVVTPLLHLTVLGVRDELGDDADDRKVDTFHAECGVLDPSREADEARSGQGVRVTIGGSSRETFADVIVGRQVEESSAARDVRYLRVPGERVVYTADFSVRDDGPAGGETQTPFDEALSTEPVDWIDRDILRVSRWDIRTMVLHDYPRDAKTKKGDPRGCVVLKQDPTNSTSRAWSCDSYFVPDTRGKYVRRDGLPPEKVYNDKVNAAADALAHMALVAVERKPDDVARVFREGLSFREMTTRNLTLEPAGFFVEEFDTLAPEKSEPVMTGALGLCAVTMKDGVELVILFGEKRDDSRRMIVYARYKPVRSDELEPLKKVAIPANASNTARNRAEEENRRIESENAIRKSKYEVERSEGVRRAAQYNERFAPWIYLVPEKDAQAILLHEKDVIKP